MKKKLLVCVGALVAAQLLSGCYVLRELDWNASKIKNGDKATATLGLQGTDTNTANIFARGGTPGEGRVFLAALGEGGDGLTFKRPTFDSTDQIGAKEKLTEDPDLRDLVF